MKKIVYLHGLESDQGGRKVNFLTTKGLVFAPDMKYKENPKKAFNELLNQIKTGVPDVIIGSSMGGVFAHNIAKKLGIRKVILFNPGHVITGRFPEIEIDDTGTYEPSVTVTIGLNDDVVDPNESGEYFEKLGAKMGYVKGMGHRTNYEVFESIINSEI